MARKTSSTNYSNLQTLVEQCPMQTALGQIGGRWKVLILWYVHLGGNRYSDLLGSIPGITRKMLTQQLHELVADGLLLRQVPDGQPANRPVYVLASPAIALLPVLQELNAWGRSRQGQRQ